MIKLVAFEKLKSLFIVNAVHGNSAKLFGRYGWQRYSFQLPHVCLTKSCDLSHGYNAVGYNAVRYCILTHSKMSNNCISECITLAYSLIYLLLNQTFRVRPCCQAIHTYHSFMIKHTVCLISISLTDCLFHPVPQ